MVTDLKERISLTLGAVGIFINNELAKNVIRRRASEFRGTSAADSLKVRRKWSLETYRELKKRIINKSQLAIFQIKKECVKKNSLPCPSKICVVYPEC